MNIIWKNAIERANLRLKPIELFMNSIRNIREETDSKLNLLTKNESLFTNFYRIQNEQNIQQLIDILTKAEYDFNTDFKNLINYLKESMNKLNRLDNQFNNKLDDQFNNQLDNQFNNQLDKQLINLENDEKQESIFNCLNILIETMNNCKIKCDELKNECSERMSIASWFICKPIAPENVCKDIIDKVKTNECLKIDQRSLNQTKISKFIHDLELTKSFMKFGNLKIIENNKLNFNRSIDETEQFSRASFLLVNKIELFFEQIQNYWKYLAFIFLLICLYRSNKYLLNYLNDITFDNRLITNYFKHLDYRRKLQRRRTILPLNPLISSLACELFDLRCLSFENRNEFSYLTIISIVILNLLAFFINQIFIIILEEINRYFRIDFNYKSNFNLNVTVSGTGFIAQKIRNILRNFKHVSTGVHYVKTTTKDCIRNVEYLDLNQLYLCFLFLFIYLLIKRYYYLICRFRSRIMSLFYPELEKKRIIYLYNGMLNETLNMFKNSILNVYSKLNDDNDKFEFTFNDVIIEFRNLLFKYFEPSLILKLPFINRDHCKICDQKEYRNQKLTKINFCYQCYLTYCYRCFKFLNFKCLNCDLPNLGNKNSHEDNKTKFL